jgi:hypothetical protein
VISRYFQLFLVVLAIAVVAPAVDAREKKARPDLTGAWAINGEKSDSSNSADRTKGKSSHKPIFGPPRGGFGPIGGAGGGGPMVKNKPDEETVARSKELARIAAEPPKRLIIASDGDTLSLTNEVGHIVKLRTDGQKTFDVSEGGLELERKAHWDDEKLVCDIKAKGGGGEIKQVITREGDRLIVQSNVDSDLGERTVKLRHVYDLTP